MTNRQIERLAAGSGIIGALMTVTYVVMPPYVGNYPYTRQAIADMARNHEGILFKNLLGTLSFLLFLFFLGSLYSVLRRAEGGTGWLSLLAFGGGLALTAVHALESVVSYALAWHVTQQGNVAVVTALGDIENLVAYFYAVPLSVLLIATSVVAFRTSVLPRWLAWIGLVAGGVWLVGAVGVVDPQNGPLTAIGFGGGLVLFFLIWIPATSIAVMRLPEEDGDGPSVAMSGALQARAR